jgi:hypothetical protein
VSVIRWKKWPEEKPGRGAELLVTDSVDLNIGSCFVCQLKERYDGFRLVATGTGVSGHDWDREEIKLSASGYYWLSISDLPKPEEV